MSHSGDQYAVLNGFASDDVARMELFLSTGERRSVPLRDNAYVVVAPRAKYPIRLVAYDGDGRVLGFEHFAREPLAGIPGPVPNTRRLVHTVFTPRGTRLTLEAGASQDGGRCYRVEADGEGKGELCVDPKFDDVGLYALRAESGRFLMGPVPASARRVELQFEGGEKRKPCRIRKVYVRPSAEMAGMAAATSGTRREPSGAGASG